MLWHIDIFPLSYRRHGAVCARDLVYDLRPVLHITLPVYFSRRASAASSCGSLGIFLASRTCRADSLFCFRRCSFSSLGNVAGFPSKKNSFFPMAQLRGVALRHGWSQEFKCKTFMADGLLPRKVVLIISFYPVTLQTAIFLLLHRGHDFAFL